jgi:hypothetical protein
MLRLKRSISVKVSGTSLIEAKQRELQINNRRTLLQRIANGVDQTLIHDVQSSNKKTSTDHHQRKRKRDNEQSEVDDEKTNDKSQQSKRTTIQGAMSSAEPQLNPQALAALQQQQQTQSLSSPRNNHTNPDEIQLYDTSSSSESESDSDSDAGNDIDKSEKQQIHSKSIAEPVIREKAVPAAVLGGQSSS